VIIEKNVEIKSFSHIEGATLRKGAVIGPFARIRPNSDIGKDARIGNFVEVKNSNIDNNSKINHLSYIGDTNIANNVNIGAGVITCNYDGYNKSNTNIEENVFIGSNSSLIAPVNIGAGSLIAAGSVITQNINAGDLAIARSSQENIIDGAKKYHKKKQDLKKK
jgi:bifunctional UDP-N-acetylglucosamine pyrophosphorylase/glucosamine-1-phosphate N-acetyltransferase